MQRDDCPVEVLQPILDRIHLDSLGSISRYRATLSDLGFEELDVVDLTPNLTTHYARVLDEVRANQWDLLKVCSAEYIEAMQTGLQHWVDGGRGGHLQWGILHFPEGLMAKRERRQGIPRGPLFRGRGSGQKLLQQR